MAARNNCPQSPPLDKQTPQQMRIGIETSLDPNMPEFELSPSPVAGGPGSDYSLGLYYRVDGNELETWAKNTNIFIYIATVLGVQWRSQR